MTDIPKASRRLLESVDLDPGVIEVFPQGTRTAEDAANAIGCPVAAIVKSLVFTVDDHPVVALVPGDLRLDTDKLSEAAGGGTARRASLDEVRDATGYAAGGVPPFGHTTNLGVYADPALKRNDPVWSAAGTPTAVFPLSILELDRLAGPVWVTLT